MGAALDTTYRPSLSRPIEVYVSGFVDTDPGDVGQVRYEIGATDPPGDTIMQARGGVGGLAADEVIGAFYGTFLVKPGEYYRITTAVIAGTPTFTLYQLWEQEL